MAINVGIERIGYKPLRGQPRLAPLITAIGFSFILQGIGLSWKGGGRVAVPQIIPDTVLVGENGTLLDFGDYPYYTVRDLMVLLITIPVLVALTVLVQRTKPGKAMRATARDRDAAAMMGISVDRTISFTFLIAGSLAGTPGVVYAPLQCFKLRLYAAIDSNPASADTGRADANTTATLSATLSF